MRTKKIPDTKRKFDKGEIVKESLTESKLILKIQRYRYSYREKKWIYYCTDTLYQIMRVKVSEEYLQKAKQIMGIKGIQENAREEYC